MSEDLLTKISSSLAHKLERLRPVTGKSNLVLTECALKNGCQICASRGFITDIRGAYLHARICDCVRYCNSCFGQAQRLEAGKLSSCSSSNPTRIVNILNDAHIPARYAAADLQAFQNYSGNGRQVMQQIQRWLANFQPSRSAGLVLSGGVGVGKTFVLCAIARHLATAGYSVRFADFFQLLGDLKQGYAEGKADPAVIEPLVSCDVLIVDELGKGRSTDWEIGVADSLISERYNRNKCLIASTNYLLTSFKPKVGAPYDLERDATRNQMNAENFGSLEARLGPRIFSRLKEMTFFCELTGDDFRKH